MEELKLNHTYLVQFGNSDGLSSITILMISDKAYHIQWNNDTKNSTWEQKKVFNNDYDVVEDISDFIKNKLKEEIFGYAKTKLIQCRICHGFGTVPDNKNTAGTIPCPLCHGSKMIPEIIEI